MTAAEATAARTFARVIDSAGQYSGTSTTPPKPSPFRVLKCARAGAFLKLKDRKRFRITDLKPRRIR